MATKPAKKTEPSWLVHFHYGPDAKPLTVFDNHDGTFTYMDDHFARYHITAEAALRLFTVKMNGLALSNQKLRG